MSKLTPQEELMFLWDKWKHHDGLMHQRQNSFWTFHAVILAFITFVIGKYEIEGYSLIAIGVCLAVIGIFGTQLRHMMQADRTCRNSYNSRIFQILSENTNLIECQDIQKESEGWCPKNNAHSMNLWHTPRNENNPKKFVSTNIVSFLVWGISLVEIASGILLLVIGVMQNIHT